MLIVVGIARLKSLAKDRGAYIMFRKMRRFKQQITDAECIEILKKTKRGVPKWN